ncbi:Tyrosine-protein kinase receptor Tie-1 [Chionoecetes opilio]|uniref:Tyrosine-protein kinase receptor Tie-1 n=1 Tax=Chionoecetes opilio TaxID=41210 RepID=A0A8J4XRA1_CHIOP|nr:Tyrosine-protein kinase receptor Tie-1 [Chionoecetes opilio]
MDSQGRGGVVRWTALLAMACFFPRSFASDEIKNSSSSPGAASVPDFSAVYKVDRNYPGTSVIACVTEDTNTTIITRLVPPRLPSPTFKDRGWAQEVQWPALKQGERGCTVQEFLAPPDEKQGVEEAVPQWSRFPRVRCVRRPPDGEITCAVTSRLVPQYLSYTISPGEELRARLLGAEPRGAVWWQREPLQPAAWRHTTLDDNGTLIIPAAMLSGSGFYSFANENNVIDTRILGTFSLQIRDCPAHRYGEDCSDWCPDCLHGGVCHPRSGQCVCQESLMGRRCEVCE